MAWSIYWRASFKPSPIFSSHLNKLVYSTIFTERSISAENLGHPPNMFRDRWRRATWSKRPSNLAMYTPFSRFWTGARCLRTGDAAAIICRNLFLHLLTLPYFSRASHHHDSITTISPQPEMAYIFSRSKADAVISTLYSVNDGSSASHMKRLDLFKVVADVNSPIHLGELDQLADRLPDHMHPWCPGGNVLSSSSSFHRDERQLQSLAVS